MAQQVWTTIITQRELSDQATEQQGIAWTSPAATQIDPEDPHRTPLEKTHGESTCGGKAHTAIHGGKGKDKKTAAEEGSRQQGAARPESGVSGLVGEAFPGIAELVPTS